MPSLRIVYDSRDAADGQMAAALAGCAPADFQVTLAALREGAWTSNGSGPSTDLLLVLAERQLRSIAAALRSATGPSTLVTVFRAAWPERLPAFYEIYGASDAVLLASAEYLEGTGRLPGAYLFPGTAEAETFAVLRRIAADGDKPTARGPAGPDLTGLVTIFLTTIGAPSYAACRGTLARQDCTFTLVLIDHVTPLTAALQRMLEDCATPYYVQVDEDMLLYPHAIRTLYERIAGSAPEIALAAGDLYDVHLRHRVEGIKIFRHAINRQYPWEPELTAVERLQRLAADGYGVLRTPNPNPRSPTATLGLHGTHWTPRSIYERYRREERLRRRWPELFGVGWGPALLQRFLEERSPLDLFAVLGAMAGALEPPDTGGVTPDAGFVDGPRGLEALRGRLAELDPEPDDDRS